MNQNSSPAPFGVATKRFCRLGFHPELDKSGAYKQVITKTGPGTYNPTKATCRQTKGHSWKRKLELEEFSEYLGFQNAKILNERNFRKTLGGPGFSDINYDYFKPDHSSVFENSHFGRGERFKYFENNNPPPGTYTKHLTIKKTFAVPEFEWDGLAERFKDQTSKFQQPPNLYNPIDPKGLQATLNKIVSLKGPYNLFTGPRDESTIKNYFSSPNFKPPDVFFLPLSDIDEMLQKRPCYGKFLQANRFPRKPTIKSMMTDVSLCFRDPRDPGPAHYNLEHTNAIRKASESLYPFNSSNIYAQPPIKWEIKPGPGRYYPRPSKCMKLKRPSWVFLSKQKRQFFPKIETYAAF